MRKDKVAIKNKFLKNGIIFVIFLVILELILNFSNKSLKIFQISEKTIALSTQNALTNTTRVYFLSEITQNYGNGDCILLENYDNSGNKKYGLIDAGRKIEINNNTTTSVKEFLNNHGVEKLDFFAITHSHADHTGDALTVINNFEIEKIYMKEFDKKWAQSGNSNIYENILKAVINKNKNLAEDKQIKIIGVSYEALFSEIISPSRSSSFINFLNENKNIIETMQNNFSEFNTSNIEFNFGGSQIKIFNWEIFNENGEQLFISNENGGQYITTNGQVSEREFDSDENNNSIGLLLMQGTKKAFFSGDMNNLDKNDAKGILGDEDRIKNEIGKIDLLKLGHHGGDPNSNTKDYMDTLCPNYIIITGMLGGACNEMTEWIENNNPQYLYTTNDVYEVSATITNEKVYLGLGTDNIFNTVNKKLYFIPEGAKYEDYTEAIYEVKYIDSNDNTVTCNNWNDLKNIIEDINNINNNAIINDIDKTYTIKKLNIILEQGGDWIANSSIKIKTADNIVLTTSDNINIVRGANLIENPMFYINGGNLSIGKNNMLGTITLDGNKENVEAQSALIIAEAGGIIDLYSNVMLCNNLNKTTKRTKAAVAIYYSSFGSGIYADNSKINMYGGSISNNCEIVDLTCKLPETIGNKYYFNTMGVGIYLSNNGELNMTGGSINNNTAINNSIVKTADTYTIDPASKGIWQCCNGTAIYAPKSTVNLSGGEIKENKAYNNSQLELKTSTGEQQTYIYSTNNAINGVGVYAGSKLSISNNFKFLNNEAYNEASVNLEQGTAIKNAALARIIGTNIYANKVEVEINNATFSGGKAESNVTVLNEGQIGVAGNGSVNTKDLGGAIALFSLQFNISNISILNNTCGVNSGYGGGIYFSSCAGTIDSSNFSNNKAITRGGAICIDGTSNIEIENSTFSNNNSPVGGAICVSNSKCTTKINNVTINNNIASNSGGGIYSEGNFEILGDNTLIEANKAINYGGGIMAKGLTTLENGTISKNEAKYGGGISIDGEFVINNGKIKENESTNSGGGIQVGRNGYEGKLTMNGGIITQNSAKTTGGGINFSKGIFNLNGGTIINNNALDAGNETYPVLVKKIEILELPAKTSYIQNCENLNLTGGKIKVLYADEIFAEKEITQEMVTGFDNTKLGTNTITVEYEGKTTTFEVIIEANAVPQLEIEFEEYNEINKNDRKYIENIQPKTTLEEFVTGDKIKTNGNIDVIKNGQKITDSETKISTGMTLKISLNNETIEYIIVVRGDTNGDGDSNISDIMQVNKHRLKKTQLTNENFLAGDLNKNNDVDINDLMKINKFRLKKINIL